MDKLLDAVKDLSAIKRYLAAINQVTDDFLFVVDIPGGKIEFFRPVEAIFGAKQSEEQVVTFEDFISRVHTADRKVLSRDMSKIRNGERLSQNIDFRMINHLGKPVWVNSRGKVLNDENGEPFMMIGRLSEEALRHLFDPVTGLWNKVKLREDLRARLHREKGFLMMFEIPSFADVCLTHGRSFGNELLCELADVIEEIECVEESYHIDNSKLAIIINQCNDTSAELIYDKICQKMNEKCSIAAGVVPIDDSIFIDVSQIIDSANITLRDALQSASLVFFSSDDINRKISDITLLEELKESVQNDFSGFEVYYQPQLKSESYELYGIEALLRYNSRERGRVFPDEFIPILEQSGLIDVVGLWVLETALTQCKEWRKSIPELQVAVNFSSVQFEDESLGDKIIDTLKRVGMPGSALTVELTESVQLVDGKKYLNIIKQIKSFGVRFAIDDFGTGYSSFGYLKQLDVNEIKIDRSFVSKLEKNTYNYRLISNVIEFAKANSIHACCEGVETAKELSVLEPLQVDFFQGYLFDRPRTTEEISRKYICASSEEYKARLDAIEEICKFKEQFGSIHFDPKNILRENDIGLWIVRIDEKKNHRELHADIVMEKVLGLSEKISPDECYEYWHSRILADDVESVDDALRVMINNGRAVQFEYRWLHPSIGEVEVRSSGIRTQDKNGMVMLEGYHRILTGVEGV